jgi:hypothetical protein
MREQGRTYQAAEIPEALSTACEAAGDPVTARATAAIEAYDQVGSLRAAELRQTGQLLGPMGRTEERGSGLSVLEPTKSGRSGQVF